MFVDRAGSRCAIRSAGAIEGLHGSADPHFFLIFPRIALLLLYFFSTYLDRAYHGWLVPLLGFIFLPLTTLVYAWMVNSHLAIAGVNLILLIIAVVIDIGGWGGGYRRRSSWY